MVKINFDAKVWKQGNSLIVTIPIEFKNTHGLKEGDIMRISAGLISEKEQKEEAELRRLATTYPLYGEGSIIHKNEDVIRLKQVFCRLMEFRGGTLALGQSFDDLPVMSVVAGVIREGNILHKVYDEKHYSPLLRRDPYFKRNLSGIEKIKIKTTDGKKLIIKNVRFESDILKEDSNLINTVEFYGDLEKITD